MLARDFDFIVAGVIKGAGPFEEGPALVFPPVLGGLRELLGGEV